MNKLCATLTIAQTVVDPPVKGKNIPCLLWADDVVLISKSEIVSRTFKNIAISGKW